MLINHCLDLNNPTFSDAILIEIKDDVKISRNYVHRVILALKSTYFSKLFEEEKPVYQVPDLNGFVQSLYGCQPLTEEMKQKYGWHPINCERPINLRFADGILDIGGRLIPIHRVIMTRSSLYLRERWIPSVTQIALPVFPPIMALPWFQDVIDDFLGLLYGCNLDLSPVMMMVCYRMGIDCKCDQLLDYLWTRMMLSLDNDPIIYLEWSWWLRLMELFNESSAAVIEEPSLLVEVENPQLFNMLLQSPRLNADPLEREVIMADWRSRQGLVSLLSAP